jgi:small-conductance mechanosensitive channel
MNPTEQPEDETGLSLLRPVKALQELDSRTRPDLKKAIPATVIAFLAFVVGTELGGLNQSADSNVTLFGWQLNIPAGWVVAGVLLFTFIFALAGVIAGRSIGNELQRVSERRAGPAAGAAVRLICVISAGVIVVVGCLAILGIDPRTLLVGGAVTGVIIGIAAQQTLNNFFAGLVLFFARPYVAGQRVKIRSGSMGGPFVGTIVGAGLMYTLIDTDEEGIISMPNAGLMGAAVGPAPADEPDGDYTPSDSPDPDAPRADEQPPERSGP